MNKVIFTADDFGVVPSINKAVTDMVNMGLINSVEVITNFEKSIENLNGLIEDTNGADFELGVHLTITSGKPLTHGAGIDPLLDDGAFKKFSAINSRADNQALYNELKAQVEVLMDSDFKDRVTHMTCHHDSLWFFPEYTKQLAKVSEEYNLPVRNPRSFPPKRDKLYYSVILPILKTFSFTLKDIDLLRDTYKLRKKGRFPGVNLNYRAPDYMDSRHYGPIPNSVINADEKAGLILKKHNRMDKMLRKAKVSGGKKKTHLIEFMFHLRKGDLEGGHKRFCEEVEELDYEGINPHYFDSRTVEYESLRFYEDVIKAKIGTDFELGSWKDAPLFTLKKK